MDENADSLRIACADLNGQMRGARLPGHRLPELEFSGHRFPLSMLGIDITDREVDSNPMGTTTGNADGQLRCTERDPVPMPWLAEKTLLVPMWMFTDKGKAYAGDPRQVLAHVLRRLNQRNWRAQASCRLEFILFSADGSDASKAGANGSVGPLDNFSAFFDDLFSGAAVMGIALEQCASGDGPGQHALELGQSPAMRTADDIWLAKSLVKGIARARGLTASFLAQASENGPGSGMHVRVVLTDKLGRNLFDNGLMSGSGRLRHAVAGCIAGMPGSTLMFAPHANSYARTRAHALAPSGASWGYENRTTALRIPGGDPHSRCIEHRTPGADANPYLAMAAVLGTAVMGLEDALTPPDPIVGDAYGQRILQVPTDWAEAIERFSASPKTSRIFPDLFIRQFTAIKQQELRNLGELSFAEQRMALLEAV